MLDPHDDPSSPAAPSAAAPTARTPGTRAPDAHLAWRPSWRDRLEGAIGSTPTGRLVAAAAAVVAGLVIVGVVLLRGPAPPPPELALPVAGAQGDPAVTTTTASPTSSTSAPDADVVVHAAGAVARPGVYRLAGGARVSELLDAAGGPAPGADLDRLNLAAPLVDGEQVFVPLPDQDAPLVGPPGGGAPAAPATTPPGLVDLNRATLDELDELPGVGPSTAQAILDERERRGGFTAVDELLDVRGIGDAKLAALRDLVRV